MEISNPNIDKKVCSGSHAKGNSETTKNNTVASYTEKPTAATATAQCSGFPDEAAGNKAGGLNRFVSETKVEEGKNWPTGKIHSGSSTNNVDGTHNGNAKAVATDLTKLTSDEKTIVAGLLAKTIEGGEVVEIRAVSSTSVMALELWVCWLL